MSSEKLSQIANFLKRWKNCVLFIGYNKKGVLCVCMKRGNHHKEVPYTWELICDDGISAAWQNIKNFLGTDYSLAYEAHTESLISSGFFTTEYKDEEEKE